MSKVKPTIPKGMRDFGPEQVFKRQYILKAIKNTFEKFGFLPLETPTMENISVLTGKYGEEGDQLLFKVLNSGNFFKGSSTSDKLNNEIESLPIDKLSQEDKKYVSTLSYSFAEKGLRYDLTIPFARYVAMNQNEIAFPFKRYQIQPVWRADRPQKGRYREFYQCDADVIGSNSLLSEAEIIMMIQEVFGEIGITDYTIKINNRKVLQGLAEAFGIEDKFIDLTVAIDKLDKIGIDKVLEELSSKNISQESLSKIKSFLASASNLSDTKATLSELTRISNNNENVEIGNNEIITILDRNDKLGGDSTKIQFDPTLARGLNYYTGCIFEVVVNNVQIGSVSGGGRYDNLTESFGLPNMSGVGFSFGLDRIYDVMTELDLFPKEVNTSTEIIIIPFDEESFNYSLGLLQKLRNANIKSELYPDLVKFKKSMKYANDKNIPYVIIIGEEEVKSNQLSFKNMSSGVQEKLNIEDIITYITTLNKG